MSWIDEARKRVVKRKAQEIAAAEAKNVEEAKAQLRRAIGTNNKFVADVKGLLPIGVELVTAFKGLPPGRVGLEESGDTLVYPPDGFPWVHLEESGNRLVYPPDGLARVHVGDGVQFDLVYVQLYGSGDGSGIERTYRMIRVYKAGGPYGGVALAVGIVVVGGWEGWLTVMFPRARMEELLLEAWEKYDVMRASG